MKRIFAMILSVALFLCGCGQAAASSEVVVEAPQGAATVLGRVNGVSGNDITLSLGTYGGTVDSGSAATLQQSDEVGAPTNENARSEGYPSKRAALTLNAAGGTAPSDGGTAPSGGEMPVLNNAPSDGESGGAGRGANGGANNQNVTFRENGETLSVRIPVGTPIAYGSLKVDFSQLQTNYIVSLTLGGADGSTVVAGEILST